MIDGAHRDEEIRGRAEAQVGRVLRDKWRLDRLIGIGGMAAVYAATHRNGKRAAVKVLHPEAALAPLVKERFLREGYVANKVEHSGAVSILDDDVDADGTVFLVMELLHGETLDARCGRRGGTLEAEEVLQIADLVLDCLSAAHDKGIVHRDLKPGNLFITEDGATKILDFGIAHLEETGSSKSAGTGSQTLGTPGFMPPEQARGRWNDVDAKSDLWAVGAVMFAALSGRHVHEAPTVNEQLLAAMTVPAERLRERVPNAHELVASLVDRALEFSKENRWQDARTMQAAVRSAYETLTGKPLALASRLAGPPRTFAVKADVATLDESADVQAPRAGQTTARPVIDSQLEVQASKSRVLPALALGLLAIGAVSVGLARRGKPEPPSPALAAPPAASAPVSPPASALAAAPPPLQLPPAEPPRAAALPRPAPSPAVEAPRRKVRKAQPPAAAKSAAPPESIDLFTRRR